MTDLVRLARERNLEAAEKAGLTDRAARLRALLEDVPDAILPDSSEEE